MSHKFEYIAFFCHVLELMGHRLDSQGCQTESYTLFQGVQQNSLQNEFIYLRLVGKSCMFSIQHIHEFMPKNIKTCEFKIMAVTSAHRYNL